jgi:DNA-binding MarR family transcriptional regulator
MLIAHVDALAEQLRPKRRTTDRDASPCSPQELFALNTIGRQGRLTMTELATALRVPASTASRLVDRLAEKGLVARTLLAADRRVVHVSFSRRGERINTLVAGTREDIAAGMLAALGPRERSAVLHALARLAGSLS